MQPRWSVDLTFLEQGDIYFFYKPKKGVREAKDISDISRFYIVTDPYADKPPRYIVIGRKRLPAIYDGGETLWGFIEKIGGRGYKVKNNLADLKRIRGAARPAGEGIYALVNHGEHTH